MIANPLQHGSMQSKKLSDQLITRQTRCSTDPIPPWNFFWGHLIIPLKWICFFALMFTVYSSYGWWIIPVSNHHFVWWIQRIHRTSFSKVKWWKIMCVYINLSVYIYIYIYACVYIYIFISTLTTSVNHLAKFETDYPNTTTFPPSSHCFLGTSNLEQSYRTCQTSKMPETCI